MISEVFEEGSLDATDIIQKLEQIECRYWMHYYTGNKNFSTYSSVLDKGLICAVPSVDVLAMNRVIGVGIRKKIEQSTLDHILNFYQKAGSSRFFIQLPRAVAGRTKELLEKSGFHNYNEWTKLYREVKPTGLSDTNLTIRKIDREEADLYGQLIFMSFDWQDSRLASWLASTVGVDGYQHYIVSKEGKAIAAGALYVEKEMASMAFAGTLQQFRGQGAQRLLLETRINEAYKLGAKVVTAETAKHSDQKEVMSFKNMLKVGFKTAYHRQNWLYKF